MKLSVIVVSYNAVDFLRQCLASIEKHSISSMEIIVWDNHSPDRNVLTLEKEFPSVRFIFHNENLGFSRANNRAVALSNGEYVLILNPDTKVDTQFFERILSFAEKQPNLGAVGVQMVDGEGSFLPESKRNLPQMMNAFSKLFRFNFKNEKSYYANQIESDEVGEVEVLSGACMLLRKSTFEKVGGFDERYFMYGEDIDLSYTLLNQGYQNYYLGTLKLIHYKGESTVKNKQYLQRFYGAMLLFIEKYEKPKSKFKYYLALLGIKVKYFIELLKLKLK